MEEPFAEVVVPLEVSVVGRGGEEVLEVVEDEEGPPDAVGDAVHVALELKLAAVVSAAPADGTEGEDEYEGRVSHPIVRVMFCFGSSPAIDFIHS